MVTSTRVLFYKLFFSPEENVVELLTYNCTTSYTSRTSYLQMEYSTICIIGFSRSIPYIEIYLLSNVGIEHCGGKISLYTLEFDSCKDKLI